ncbi:MAG: DUF1592 domain-containing protein [Myxococcales bacterium]|nr:DUF1592 domain-containing protein [Myxococcales bacterium]
MRGIGILLVGCSVIALAACTGTIGGDPAGANDGDDGDGCVGCTDSGIQIVGSSRFPRLSHAQWENTVVDLFSLPSPTGLSSSFAPDPLGGKAFDNNEASLSVSSNLWADYQAAAEEVATLVTSDPALLANIVPADLPASGPARRDAWIAQFGKRVFRRPLAANEVTTIASVFDQGATYYASMDPFAAGVRTSIEYLLQSPHFVYRAQLTSDVGENQLITLSGWEIASRISYAVWDSMPDDELFAAAEAGQLDTIEGLEAQVDRLLASDRARETFRRFHDQLWKGEQYASIAKSPTLYPDFDAAVAADMRMELAKFVTHTVAQGGGVRDLLLSRTTFVTPEIAAIYGIDPATLPTADADGFSQVELDPNTRAGFLTLSGFLSYKGTATQPDTILRGVFVNLKVLCQDLGDPPNEAMGAHLGDEPTNREKVNALTGPGTCGASCHGNFINPIGYAFEHFGAVGEYRTEDNGYPIDSSSTYAFADGERSYNNAVELAQILAESPQVHGCFSKFWVEFGLGRTVMDDDKALIDLVAAESQAGASVKELLRTLLTSEAIRYRLATEGQ